MEKYSNCFLWIFRIFLIFCVTVNVSNACTCLYHHPQSHYCNSDFVALVKVKQRGKSDGRITSYHIKVKKEFKMNEKTRHALSQGLIWTASDSSLCGINLKQSRYLIAGRMTGEKLFINLCHFVQEWSTLTVKQKKGFRRLYQQGCQCKIPDFSRPRSSNRTSVGRCDWDTSKDGKFDCQNLYSVCAPSSHASNECVWLKSRAYRHCMKERQIYYDREP